MMRFIAQIWHPQIWQTRLKWNIKACVSAKKEAKCDGTGGNSCLFVACENIEFPARSAFPMEEERSSALWG